MSPKALFLKGARAVPNFRHPSPHTSRRVRPHEETVQREDEEQNAAGVGHGALCKRTHGKQRQTQYRTQTSEHARTHAPEMRVASNLPETTQTGQGRTSTSSNEIRSASSTVRTSDDCETRAQRVANDSAQRDRERVVRRRQRDRRDLSGTRTTQVSATNKLVQTPDNSSQSHG